MAGRKSHMASWSNSEICGGPASNSLLASKNLFDRAARDRKFDGHGRSSQPQAGPERKSGKEFCRAHPPAAFALQFQNPQAHSGRSHDDAGLVGR